MECNLHAAQDSGRLFIACSQFIINKLYSGCGGDQFTAFAKAGCAQYLNVCVGNMFRFVTPASVAYISSLSYQFGRRLYLVYTVMVRVMSRHHWLFLSV